MVSADKEDSLKEKDHTLRRAKSYTTPRQNTTTLTETSTISSDKLTSSQILAAALRETTKRKYHNYLEKWNKFCETTGINAKGPNVEEIMEFLTSLYNKGLSYSSLNSAKSAIATVVDLPGYTSISQHPKIDSYFKGLFNLRPPKTKLSTVWDVKIIFDYYKDRPNNNLDDKTLTQKLLMFLLLLSGQRLNTIFWYTVDRLIISDNSFTFAPEHVLKHSRRGNKLDSFTYYKYEEDKCLCVYECLVSYLERRSKKVDGTVCKLFITHGKPHKEASRDTLSRWVKEVFRTVGIMNIYTPHSCRAASTSKANYIGVSIDEIVEKGCWKNLKTFQTHYNKNIVINNNKFQNILK